MYQDFFQLSERPFASAPYAPHYCPSKYFDKALHNAQQAVDESLGTVLVFGENGIGKSMFLELLSERYRNYLRVVRLVCSASATRTDLLQNILFELDRPYQGMREGELRLALMDFLKPGEKCKNGLLLLIDDAQTLSSDLLQELNTFAGFVREGRTRVRTVLAGTHQLEELLTLPALNSFSQRVAARCYLQPMTRDESIQYIEHHLLRTGRRTNEIFSPDAIARAVDFSDGVPRIINQIMCQSLILGAAHSVDRIDQQVVDLAWQDIQQLPTDFVDGASETDSANATGWAVVEFGELDQSGDQSKEMSDIDPPESSLPAASSNCEDGTGPKLYRVDEHAVERSGAEDSHFAEYANPTRGEDVSENENSPSVPSDVFGAEFHQVEVVEDRFAQWAAQQNRCSLEVTDEQLEQLLAQAELVKRKLAEHEVCTSDQEVLLPGIDGAIDTALEPAIEDIAALMEPDSTIAAGAEQISLTSNLSEIRRMTSGHPSSEQAVPHSLVGDVADLAVDSTAAETPAALPTEESQHPTAPLQEFPLAEFENYRQHDASVEYSNSDDREMLLVSFQNQEAVNRTIAEPEPKPEEPSQGSALRMNYKQLFQRLKQSS